MITRFYAPRKELYGLVKGYQIGHSVTPKELPLRTYPFPPHAVQNLAFYPRDPIHVFSYRSGKTTTMPQCISVGPKVSRIDFTMGRELLIVATFFEAGGLHRLLGVPMTEFFDDAFDISLLWNAEIRVVNEQLCNTDSYDEMQQIVETFLVRRFRCISSEARRFDNVLLQLADPMRHVSLDYLADQSCLSIRQFERKCQEQIGLSPKLFRRIARFSKAFRLKEQQPQLDWLDIALYFGYHDLQHMRRDFKEFAFSTPTTLLQEELRTEARPYSSHNF